MQLDFKENIQNTTNGEIYVKLAPGGQLGAGGALAQKVQAGTIQAAQHSLSNFAPFAPAVDLINVPYWCGENQKFINLVTSDTWRNEINPKVEAKGFKPLWYVCIDPRVVVALRKGGDGSDQDAGANGGHQVPGARLGDPAAVLPPARRQSQRRSPGAKPPPPSSRASPTRWTPRSRRCTSSASRTSSPG